MLRIVFEKGEPSKERGIEGPLQVSCRAGPRDHFVGVIRRFAKSPLLLLPTQSPTIPRSSVPSLRTSSVTLAT